MVSYVLAMAKYFVVKFLSKCWNRFFVIKNCCFDFSHVGFAWRYHKEKSELFIMRNGGSGGEVIN